MAVSGPCSQLFHTVSAPKKKPLPRGVSGFVAPWGTLQLYHYTAIRIDLTTIACVIVGTARLASSKTISNDEWPRARDERYGGLAAIQARERPQKPNPDAWLSGRSTSSKGEAEVRGSWLLRAISRPLASAWFFGRG